MGLAYYTAGGLVGLDELFQAQFLADREEGVMSLSDD